MVVGGFGVKYIGEEHAIHLVLILKQYHEISKYYKGKKFSGIDLEWNYAKVHKDRTCRLLMRGCIADLLLGLGHDTSAKPHNSPYNSKDTKY
jgi:hypothetical protein